MSDADRHTHLRLVDPPPVPSWQRPAVKRVPACNGPCSQGREPCITPIDCQIPEVNVYEDSDFWPGPQQRPFCFFLVAVIVAELSTLAYLVLR